MKSIDILKLLALVIILCDILPTRCVAKQNIGDVLLSAYNDSASQYARVVSIEDRISETESDITKLSDRINNQYIDIFGKLVALGATVFGITVAISAFIGNMVVKDYMATLHKNLLEETQEKLDKKIGEFSKKIEQETALSVLKAEAGIYTTFAAHCINLYKDIKNPDEPAKRPLYESYLDIAVIMAYNGYSSSQQINKIYDGSPANPEYDNMFTKCLNNYAYFLAERSGQSSLRGADDRVKLGALLNQIESLCENNAGKPLWWSYRDTLIWVELHLGKKTGDEARAELKKLLSDLSIPDDWKQRTKKRYKFYNSMAQNKDRQVDLPE